MSQRWYFLATFLQFCLVLVLLLAKAKQSSLPWLCAALDIARDLMAAGYEVAVRRHPSNRAGPLTHVSGKQPIIREGPLDAFFEQLDLLISGESTLVLDAAIRGRAVVMAHELTSNDYYGHAERGVCELLAYPEIIMRLAGGGDFKSRIEAVAYFDSFMLKNETSLNSAMANALSAVYGPALNSHEDRQTRLDAIETG